MEKTETNYMITGLSILLAVSLPTYFKDVKGTVGTFLSNNILIAAFSSIILHIVLINIPRLFGKETGK